MATDLLELMSSTLGTQLVERAGGFLGASESSMKGAVGAALPALLGGVMRKASTPSGASELMKLLESPRLDPAIAGNLGSYLGGGEKTTSVLALGSEFLASLFGDKLGSLIHTIASSFGLKSASASNLMALAAPMVLGYLKSYATQNRLDAKGLASLLASQADYLKPRLDSRVTSALGFATPMAFLSSLGGAAGRAADAVGAAAGRAADAVGTAAGRAADTAGAYGAAAASVAGSAAAATRPAFVRWLPWIVLAAIALILLPQLQNCGEQATKKAGDTVGDAAKATSQAVQATTDAAKAGAAVVTKAVTSFTLPNGVKIDAADGGFVAQLIAFLSSKEAALGQGFSFDEVYFDTGSATLKPESAKQLEHVAVVLKAFPQAAIRVEGHTDNTGDGAANKQLSGDRAAAVEKALKGLGIPDPQISSVGYGPAKLETAYSKRKGTPPPPVATMATKAAEGLTLDQMSERVTTWYEANPGRHDMPVMGVMWLRMIEPHATGK